MATIAIFGAAGAIGKTIAAAIGAQGRPFRVVGRTEKALRAAFGHDSASRRPQGAPGNQKLAA